MVHWDSPYVPHYFRREHDPAEMYAIPVIGRTFRDFDQYGDYLKMQADYNRNVGRSILYPSVRAYSSSAYSSFGSGASDILGMVGRTVRSII